VVLVVHGRHGDGCMQDEDDGFTWPCFETEQRNDLGLAHVVTAIARRGAVAIAPDVNAAYTFGWGEPNERRRWRWIARRTLDLLAGESWAPSRRFGLALGGRVDATRLGLLGHSRSGANAAHLASRLDADALFLLTPAGGARLPDLPSAIALASCDGDIGGEGRTYLRRARRDHGRSEPLVEVTLQKANHNFFNRTLSDLDVDDSIGTGRVGCRDRHRLSARKQRRWLDRAASEFFAAELIGAAKPHWLRAGTPGRLYGEQVRVRRLGDR
jgi:dienelactone hydrolase